MNVLMFSIDDRLFEESSEAKERIRNYGRLFDWLWIIVFTRKDRRPQSMGPNIFLFSVAAGLSPLNFVKAYRLGSKIMNKAGANTVITSQDAFSNLVAFLLKWRYRAALQVQIHTDFLAPSFRFESFKNFLRYLIYRWSVKHADGIRVVSQRIRSSLVSRAKNLESRIAVLPIFVGVEKISAAVPAFNLREKVGNFYPIVLMVGRLTGEKNIGLAIDIFAEVVKRFPRSLLVIVGAGPEQKNLEFKIHNLKLSQAVRLEGWQADLVPYWKGADVLLVTSRYEGYGRMMIEAAASGLPIVSTDVGIAGEVLEPEESVLTFKTKDEGVRALRRLLNDGALRARLSQNARRAVGSVGDFMRYLEAYRSALESCRNRTAP